MPPGTLVSKERQVNSLPPTPGCHSLSLLHKHSHLCAHHVKTPWKPSPNFPSLFRDVAQAIPGRAEPLVLHSKGDTVYGSVPDHLLRLPWEKGCFRVSCEDLEIDLRIKVSLCSITLERWVHGHIWLAGWDGQMDAWMDRVTLTRV